MTQTDPYWSKMVQADQGWIYDDEFALVRTDLTLALD